MHLKIICYDGQGPAGENIVQSRYFDLVKVQGIVTEDYHYHALVFLYVLYNYLSQEKIYNLDGIVLGLDH